MTKSTLEGSVTRRSALRGGLACALASVVPHKILGETIFQGACRMLPGRRTNAPAQPELYAFRAAGQSLTAIAVTWLEQAPNAEDDHERDCTVRIHMGAKTWEFSVPAHGVSQSQHNGNFSVFIGNVVAPVSGDGGIARAVVMEVDAQAIDQHGSSVIWAERIMSGSRQRIGTPFLSDIIRGHQDLTNLYHASSPYQDRTLLLQPLSTEIARRLRVAGSTADPGSHARRLAYALLPDVLHYDSRLPAGFTFAARNGRHPSESSHEVVSTILNGGKPLDSSLARPRRSIKTFPYFEQPTTSV